MESQQGLDLEELCRRALADPRSITRAEGNRIKCWPPPDEEDRLCIAKTGHTRAELITKACSTPEALTEDEEGAIVSPARTLWNPNVSLEERLAPYKNPTPLDLLRRQATRALGEIRSDDEKTAVQNACKMRKARQDAANEVIVARDREAALRWRSRLATPWIKHMLRHGLLQDGKECWGFVVFRTGCYGGEEGEAAWTRFREHFELVAKTTILHYCNGPDLWPTFRTVFVEDKELDGASDDQLRSLFKRMREGGYGDGNGHLPKGIRTNCFLVADRSVIESEAVKAPWVWWNIYKNRFFEWDNNIRPDQPVVYIRALDPDHETPSRPGGEKRDEEAEKETGDVASESKEKTVTAGESNAGLHGEMKGEAIVALPRVFDWLHCVCFNAGYSESPTDRTGCDTAGWRAIYRQTTDPENWMRTYEPHTGGINYANRIDVNIR